MLLIIILYCKTLKQKIQCCLQTSEWKISCLYLFSLIAKETASVLKCVYIYVNKVNESVQSGIQWSKKRWCLWSQINERDRRKLYLNFNENS